eukprot:TRINITY_DN2839_c0_g1_i1.p1 TRINITY_DN2839_c0_g1~~TRINITY_DN2839_c0_g1_i1.p1  ORF type:complete len:79 (+),score=14.67 TRINITY_DN2839_c0_g1_i1:227-463(+)
MIDVNLEAILVKVAAEGLKEEHLGKTIKELQPYFHELQEKWGMNVAGEGGEYESFTLDSPAWRRRLNLVKASVIEAFQ